MRIQVQDRARQDLAEGIHFYEEQSPGLGRYFLDSLIADIDALRSQAGIHPQRLGFHRCLSRRFPFLIYSLIQGDLVQVVAVLDARRKPAWIHKRLRES